MQKVEFGNMLLRKSGILVHGCNAQGVMGSGIAASIRHAWPQAYEDYRYEFDTHGLKVGDVIFSDVDAGAGLYIANAITQKNYGPGDKKYVSYTGVADCMKKVAQEANDRGLSVHYPLIGAGLAGGDWGVLQACIDEAFREFPNVERTLWIID